MQNVLEKKILKEQDFINQTQKFGIKASSIIFKPTFKFEDLVYGNRAES